MVGDILWSFETLNPGKTRLHGKYSPPFLFSFPLFPRLFRLFPLDFFTLPHLRSRPFKSSWESGECCKLPQWDLWWSSGWNRVWCILALKYDIWWQQFQWRSWKLTDQNLYEWKVSKLLLSLTKYWDGDIHGSVPSRNIGDVSPLPVPWGSTPMGRRMHALALYPSLFGLCCFSPCSTSLIRTVRRTTWPPSCTAIVGESTRIEWRLL